MIQAKVKTAQKINNYDNHYDYETIAHEETKSHKLTKWVKINNRNVTTEM